MQWSSVSLELQYIWLWSDSPSASLEMQYISLSGAAIHQHLYSCRASAYKSCSASASLELQCICVSRASSHPSLGLQHLSLSLSGAEVQGPVRSTGGEFLTPSAFLFQSLFLSTLEKTPSSLPVFPTWASSYSSLYLVGFGCQHSGVARQDCYSA